MPTFVAFDLETTGLSPKNDAIIEIAMVRFDETGILDEYSSLVNPGILISPEVTNITGITDSDVAAAPKFSDIREKIVEFFGNYPIVAHNADFDTGFLESYKFDFSSRTVLDTFKIAQIAFRKERSMNLSQLAEAAGYFHEGAHRALSDARATVAVFTEAVSRISSSSGVELAAWNYLAENDRGGPFNLLMETAFPAFSPKNDPTDVFWKLESGLSEYLKSEALPKTEVDLPPPFEMLAGSGGLEKRLQQEKMTASVTEAFEKKGLLAIEAPTGIGKTFAYMVPSVEHALKTGTKVHVSTNTKTLQDQIALKDVPKLREILRPFGLSEFRFAKLKGRSNYPSLLKLSEFFDRDAHDRDSRLFVAKLSVFVSESDTCELDEVQFYGKDYDFLADVKASDPRVLSLENPYRKKEPLFRAREMAKDADVVLVNHALLLTELSDDGQGTLGKLVNVVIDEAHNLESAATDALCRTLALADIDRSFSRLESHIRRFNRKSGSEKFLFPELREFSESFHLSFGMATDHCERYAFVKNDNSGSGGYGGGRSVETLIGDDFFTIEGAASMPKVVEAVFMKLSDLTERLHGAPESLFQACDAVLADFSAYAVLLEEFLSPSRTDLIRTVTIKNTSECVLSTYPLDVSKILREKLWSKVDSAVLASATLAVDGDFSFLTKTLGLQDFSFEVLDSDFDYSKQATVFLPDDLGDPKNERDRKKALDFLGRTLKAVWGRSLCLFTSFVAIKEAYLAVNPTLKEAGMELLSQGMSGGKHKMIEQFKRHSEKSVLFGTDSFWEGVDLPGKDLELLFVMKFPFDVPTDPVVMARSKLFSDSFAQYSVPRMLLKLRQGMGRLIRTKEDRGVVVILDGRFKSGWGANAVPKAFPHGIKVRTGTMAAFAEAVEAKKNSNSSDT